MRKGLRGGMSEVMWGGAGGKHTTLAQVLESMQLA